MSTVRLEHHGALAVAVLDNPPHNLLSGAVSAELYAAIDEVAQDGTRALVIRSEGRHFCGGADVGSFAGGAAGPGATGSGERRLGLHERIEALPFPTLAAVRGVALGGGFEIALACDLIVAADTARFGLTESSFGLAPLLGGAQRVVQRAGATRAKELMFGGRQVSVDVLERWGIVNRVVPADDLVEAALAWGAELAAGPTVAYGVIKDLVRLTVTEGVAAADEANRELTRPLFATEDLKIGLTSFKERGPGKAEFVGR